MLDRVISRIKENQTDDRARPITIVALGDSVTMGCMADGEYDFVNVYHARFKRFLEERFPAIVFNVINAGIADDTASGALSRLERDVLRYSPDLILVEFGLNDSKAGQMGIPGFRRALGAIASRVGNQTMADVVMLTPNFLAARDNERLSDEQREKKVVEVFIERQKKGVLGSYAGVVREVGRRAYAEVADVFEVWQKLEDAGVDTTAMLANGLNHPTADAHVIPADLLKVLVDPDAPVQSIDRLVSQFRGSDAAS